ncbi:MAG: hypothetical protein HRU76_14995 [Phycisphaeraceae bacterium]|nr:hypothetical protein [Phycisphaerales bacterium]QOJ18811.1 MAG: hypothetical protein HRU76_14995 [Phycisphaeraceae bacterium]
MARLTAGVGVILIALGLVGYFVIAQPDAGGRSITAMIPAFFGLPLVILGVLGLNIRMRKHAMHLAALVALLGVVGALMRPAMKAARGEAIEFNAPLIMQIIMAAVCLLYLIKSVGSFVAARRTNRA